MPKDIPPRGSGEGKFRGFSRQAFSFLGSIRSHNNKAWFEAHRTEYERLLLEPLRDLVADLADFMLWIDPWFEVAPAVNKTISRIYRDTRFSNDKSPLRDSMWIVFKRPCKEWTHYAVGYFFEINATWYRYGMGFYDAAPAVMARFRRYLDEEPEAFSKAVHWFYEQDVFALEGKRYRHPRSENRPEPVRTWYDFKSFYLACNREIDGTILSSRLVDDLMAAFGMTIPLYHYVRDALVRPD